MHFQEDIECMEASNLRNLQEELLGRLLQDVKSLPSYSSLLSKYTDFTKPFNIHKRMPIIDERDYHRITLDSMNKLKESFFLIDSSSGSTGRPKRRFVTWRDELNETQIMGRIYNMMGIEKDSKMLYLDVWFPNMYPLFLRTCDMLNINPYCLNLTQPFTKTIEIFRKINPEVVLTVPSVISRITDLLEKDAKSLKWKKLVYFGESMSVELKRLLEEKFQIEIFSYYGSTEFGPMGGECEEHQGIHIWEDSLIPEVIDIETNQKRDEGALILTSLKIDGQPLIRYNINDRVERVSKKCGCGRTHSKFILKGRMGDYFSVWGSQIFINAIEDVIFSKSGEIIPYQLILDKNDDKDYLTVVLDDKSKEFGEDIITSLERLGDFREYTAKGLVTFNADYKTTDYFSKDRKIKRVIDNR